MNNYHDFVGELVRVWGDAQKIAGAVETLGEEARDEKKGPVGINFAPHPDDECINGGLLLRLQREAGMRIVNVPVTLGSEPERRAERQRELTGACNYLGFELEFGASGGFGEITPTGREENPANWRQAVEQTAQILQKYQPAMVFFPHAEDRHPTHCGTHLLVLDALAEMPADFTCLTIENEYWRAADDPNLLVELDLETVARLITALSFHRGEIKRNPYHLSLPAWLMDNVRRGSEMVGSPGDPAPDFIFGVLGRVTLFRNRTRQPFFENGRFLSNTDNLLEVLKVNWVDNQD